MDMLNSLVEELNRLISYSQYYIYFTIGGFVILFFMCLALLGRQSIIIKQNKAIMARLGADIHDGGKDG